MAQPDPRFRLRDAATERRSAATYIHTMLLALRGRGWTDEQVIKYMLACAAGIAKGAHVADPDGSGRPA